MFYCKLTHAITLDSEDMPVFYHESRVLGGFVFVKLPWFKCCLLQDQYIILLSVSCFSKKGFFITHVQILD